MDEDIIIEIPLETVEIIDIEVEKVNIPKRIIIEYDLATNIENISQKV